MKRLIAILLAAWCCQVAAQTYPNKTIKVVVPYPAGGYYDFIARVLGQRMNEVLAQPVIIENRTGANGILGTDYVAKSAPDGYTLLLGGIGPNAINPVLYDKLPYDPIRDFAPIVHVSDMPNVLVLHPSVNVKTLKDLVALARAKPGEISYASNGSGSSPHLAAEMFAAAMGIQLNHIPFKGAAPAQTAILGGQTQMWFGPGREVLPFVRAGKLQALVVTSAKRLESFPEVPTMIEVGVPNYEAVGWFAYFAPAHTPRDIVMKLNSVINKEMARPEVGARLTADGTAYLAGGSPEELDKLLKSEMAKWSEVIKRAGVKAN
jgi:tripartite-type tricarboxylate transporter receptor subunit TctC